MGREKAFYRKFGRKVSPDLVEFVRGLQQRVQDIEPFRPDEEPEVNVLVTVFGDRLQVWAQEPERGTEDDYFAITAEGKVENLYHEQIIEAEPFADTLAQVFGKRTGVTVAGLREHWDEFAEELKDCCESFIDMLKRDVKKHGDGG